MSETEKIEIHTTVTFVYKEDTKEEESIDDPVLKRPIEDLEVTVRAYHCLRGADIITIGDLIKRNKRQLWRIPNLGKKSIRDIENLLASRGLKLAD
jgi:DNA-directed RNA polymerase subunit alpha